VSRRGRPGHANGGGGAGGMGREPSMAELKKRAALMLEVISQSQKEMEIAGSRRPLVASVGGGNENGVSTPAAEKRTTPEEPGSSSTTATILAASLASELSSRLIKWQHEFTAEGGAAMVEAAGRARG
jgi:hypothetical protein